MKHFYSRSAIARLCAVFCFGALVQTGLLAQVATYVFSEAVGTYTPISGGTLLGSATSDDQRFVDPALPLGGTTTTGVGFPIGFNFTYDGVVFDRIAINNNGWISFGQSALTPAINIASTSSYIPLASTSAITPAQLRYRVAGMGRDLQAQAGASLRIETIGSAPNRVCVIQWSGYKRFGSSGTGDNFSFQIRLNEGGGVALNQTIQVVFGSYTFGSSATSTFVAQSGLGGSSSADFKGRKTSAPHDWNISTEIAANGEGLQLPFTGTSVVVPTSGRTYTWTPPVPAACPAPFGLNATAVTPTGATLNWSCTSCTGPYNIEYGPTGFTLGTGTIIMGVPASGYVLGGLSSSTAYQWYVTQDCTGGGNGFSTTSGPAAFTTSPANDLPCGATPLAFGSNGPFTMSVYTASVGEVAPPATGCGTQNGWCNSTISNTSWYSFVAPASGRITLQAQDTDTQLAIWAVGNCSDYATYTLVAANDDDGSYASHGGVLFSSFITIDCPSLTPGQTYYVQLDPYTAGNSTPTDIVLTDTGVIDAGFTGLSANACTDGGAQTLIPNAGTGTFSGPGVSGNSFDPALAGIGTHAIIYTREAPFTCFTSTQMVNVYVPGCTDPQATNYNPSSGTCDDGSCVYSAGDLTSNAEGVGNAAYPSCSNSSHNLAGFTDSPESAASGPDKWLSVVAGSPAISIELNVDGPVEVELLSLSLVSVGSLSIPAAGTWNFNVAGLTEGDTYLLSITDTGASGVNANVCSRYLPESRCDYGSGPYTLCNTFKADWVGSVQYVFNFTSTTTANTYTKNNGASTFCILSTVPGLTYGDTYDTRIDVIYNVGGSNVTVTGNEICQVIVSAQPTTVLRPSDNCGNFGPHLLGQSIAAQPFVCGATNWKWEFTRTDVPELPITHYRGSSNRFLALTSVPGLVAGATYDVRVAPVFSYGDGAFGSTDCISIVGVGGMIEMTNEGNVIAQVKLENTTSSTVMVYPNPNRGDMINLSLENITDEVVTVDVIDMFGRVVFAQQYTIEGALNTVITFDNQLSSGMYLLNVQTSAGLITERIMVQH
jgi:Secretion system C-terminal sorting domain